MHHAHSLWPHLRNRSLLVRAGKMAAGVGTVLVLINHGDKLLSGSLAVRDLVKIAVTYCVPFCVSALSAASALAAGR